MLTVDLPSRGSLWHHLVVRKDKPCPVFDHHTSAMWCVDHKKAKQNKKVCMLDHCSVRINKRALGLAAERMGFICLIWTAIISCLFGFFGFFNHQYEKK